MSIPPLTYHAPTDSTPNPFIHPSPHNRKLHDPMRTKIALVGFGEKNGRTAPYNDPEWEIWHFNMGNRIAIAYDDEGRFRADRWFDLHEDHAQDAKDRAWIHSCPVTIYLTTMFTENPHARVFPLQKVERFMRDTFKMAEPYWASSYAYCLAFAMMEDVTDIGLHGIEMDWGRERSHERANLEFMLGLALGSGINIHTQSRTLLRHPARYGFEYDKERDGVIQECGELMRQFLQAKDMKNAFDCIMDARILALVQARQTLLYTIDNCSHLSLAHLREILDAERTTTTTSRVD